MNKNVRHFILCPPTYYDIDYAINDWMNTNNKVNKSLAMNQWQTLITAYMDLQVEITLIPPVAGISELTFPGDSVFLYGKNAFISNFKYKVREPESRYMLERCKRLGYKTHLFPDNITFEGNAMLIRWNKILIGGVGVRTSLDALKTISKEIDIEVIPLKLQNPFFHLDISICPLDSDTLAFFPGAFDYEDQKRIRGMAKRVIEVDALEAEKLACNTIAVENNIILSTHECPKFAEDLKDAGFNVISLNLNEFRKAGGGAKCLTLEVYENCS